MGRTMRMRRTSKRAKKSKDCGYFDDETKVHVIVGQGGMDSGRCIPFSFRRLFLGLTISVESHVFGNIWAYCAFPVCKGPHSNSISTPAPSTNCKASVFTTRSHVRRKNCSSPRTGERPGILR